MNRQARFSILSLLTAAVWAGAVGTLAQRKKMSAKAAVSVAIATEPQRVRILVKGDRTQPPGYVETPTTLSLQPGRRKIRILREGYRGHDMTVEGDPGDMINMGSVVLERDPAARFGRLSVKVDGGPVWFEVDDGVFRGDLSAEADDIVAGVDRILSVSLARDLPAGRVRCRFTLSEAHAETPLVVSVKRLKGKGGRPDTLKVTPCDRLVNGDRKRPARQPASEPAAAEAPPKSETK